MFIRNNAGTQKDNESWKEGMNFDTMPVADVKRRAAETILKGYTDAIGSRRETLMQSYKDLLDIGAREPQCEIDEATMLQAKASMELAAVTLFEGRVLQGLRYATMARRKHMDLYYDEFSKALKDISRDAKPEMFVHKLFIDLYSEGKAIPAKPAEVLPATTAS